MHSCIKLPGKKTRISSRMLVLKMHMQNSDLQPVLTVKYQRFVRNLFISDLWHLNYEI